MPPESREESFDSFYRSTRRPLLRELLALTGDLPAAQSALREAYVAAWRSWRKVSHRDDPTSWVRSRARQLAARRHTARPWRRSKGVPDEQRAVLDALTRLPAARRRLLVSAELTDPSEPTEELSGDRSESERDALNRAREDVAASLRVSPDEVGTALRSLDVVLTDVVLPRASLIRRAGRRRRRRLGLVATVSIVLLALTAAAFAWRPDDGPIDRLTLPSPSAPTTSADASSKLPTGDDLLGEDEITRLAPARSWRSTRTGTNTSGNGLHSVCQQRRFADPRGYAALVRGFRVQGQPTRTAVQTVETSKSPRAASRGFDTTIGWYAGCQAARVQLLDSYRVRGIGTEADVLTLRVWRKPVTTLSVAVARTGAVTTSTLAKTVGTTPPAPGELMLSLADAVSRICARTGADDCVRRPSYTHTPPPPSGEERGLLTAADLPPVGRIDRPWVGTRPVTPVENPAATTCGEPGFAGAGAAKRRSRTFLIPQARLPTRFGLTETYGRFGSPKAAAAFLSKARSRLASCEKRDLSTKVSGPRTRRVRGADLSTWRLSTEVTDKRKVSFRLGFVRVGDRVAQLTFSPSSSDDTSDPAFDALLVRCGDRLRELGRAA